MATNELSRLDRMEQDRLAPFLREPPIRLSALANELGLRVISAKLPNGISGEIRPDREAAGGYVIRVNKNDSTRRQRFTVAHEIGHFLLHREEIGDGISDDILYRSTLSDSREAQANRMASDLLMPTPLVRDWIERARKLNVEDVAGFLADKFNVSIAAMKIRLGME